LNLISEEATIGRVVLVSSGSSQYAYVNDVHTLIHSSGRNIPTPGEVSCIDCNNFYIILGSWNSFTVTLLNHDLEVLHVEEVGVTMLIRSVALH
jgi:hypothetical protein